MQAGVVSPIEDAHDGDWLYDLFGRTVSTAVRYWGLSLVILAACAALGAWYGGFRLPQVYEASMAVYINPEIVQQDTFLVILDQIQGVKGTALKGNVTEIRVAATTGTAALRAVQDVFNASLKVASGIAPNFKAQTTNAEAVLATYRALMDAAETPERRAEAQAQVLLAQRWVLDAKADEARLDKAVQVVRAPVEPIAPLPRPIVSSGILAGLIPGIPVLFLVMGVLAWKANKPR